MIILSLLIDVNQHVIKPMTTLHNDNNSIVKDTYTDTIMDQQTQHKKVSVYRL